MSIISPLLQWGHGDEAVEEVDTPSDEPFRVKLQWGHGDEAVEELRIPLRVLNLLVASMGPRR